MTDMRPTLDDEVNAAWAEVNKARAENKRLREVLERIAGDAPGVWAWVAHDALYGTKNAEVYLDALARFEKQEP